jgi:DeoR family fructose operon transcriptional repressor
MLAEERRNQIINILESKGNVQVSDLSDFFAVTDETIRRDLDILKDKNLLKRTHGGAMALPNKQEISYDIRKNKNIQEKQQIAKKAAALVKPGDTIFLDISSTAMFLAKELFKMKDITIITNSAYIVFNFIDNKDVTLISTGGTLKPNSYSFVGPLAKEAVNKYFVDKFFSSCKGFSLKYGATESNDLENEVKKNMLQRSNRLFLLVDYTKINEIGLAQFASLEEIDTIIFDDKIDSSFINLLKNSGKNIM